MFRISRLFTILAVALLTSSLHAAESLAEPLAAAASGAYDGMSTWLAASMPKAGGNWVPPIWAVIPFVLMLLAIAIVPLINDHWWENDRNRGLVAAVLGIPVLVYVAFADPGAGTRIWHTTEEYISFLCLLGSLFIISGGIVITGNLRGTPIVNTGFLAVGGLIASFIGTTGAAMLLIRPLLKTNSERKHVVHIVLFFIFLVCNCAGLLTPLGDPPLFLGYLKGVPFGWTFGLVLPWVFILVVLLVIFFVFDSIQYKKETLGDLREDAAHEKPLVIRGWHNFFFLGGVVAAVALTDIFSFPTREGFMILMALAAWFTTPVPNRKHNHFGFGPIIEVVVVFAGIFSTMIPALALLQAKGAALGVESPGQFFWATGTLSSFLDNAPTYLSFLALANGVSEWAPDLAANCIAFAPGQVAEGAYGDLIKVAEPWTGGHVIPQKILEGISLGAVFMGAMTYIGNGPNFMVRAIANEAHIKMPSFFGYLVWSCIFLLPPLFISTLLFL